MTSRRTSNHPKTARPKALWLRISASGDFAAWVNPRFEHMYAKSDKRNGYRKVRYLPADSSAEARAARYERALRKIVQQYEDYNSPSDGAVMERTAIRALAKEKR